MEKVPLMPLPSPEEARKLRQRMGLNLHQAAEEIGVHRNTLQRWENGKPITPELHRKYQDTLNRWQNIINTFSQ